MQEPVYMYPKNRYFALMFVETHKINLNNNCSFTELFILTNISRHFKNLHCKCLPYNTKRSLWEGKNKQLNLSNWSLSELFRETEEQVKKLYISASWDQTTHSDVIRDEPSFLLNTTLKHFCDRMPSDLKLLHPYSLFQSTPLGKTIWKKCKLH